MNRRTSYLWLFALLFFSGQHLHSQIKIQRNLEVEDGLLQSEVWSILEDRDGYLWIGGAHGLSRWDGIDIINFQSHPEVADNPIIAIHQDADGALYLGTAKGVKIYKERKFECLHDSLANKVVMAITEDQDGRLYFGTARRGVFRYHQGQLERVDEKGELHGRLVNALYLTSEDLLYVGTSNGLSIYDDGTWTTLTTADGLANNSVLDILEFKGGRWYIGTAKGLNVFDGGTVESITSIGDRRVKSIHGRRDGAMYLGTDRGIAILEDDTVNMISEENGLADNWVTSIHAGKDGTLYFGTNAGLSIYDNGKFETLDQEGLTKNAVQTIFEDRNGRMYFSGFGDGVTIYDHGKLTKLSEEDGLVDNWVMSIAEDNKGVLYFGTDWKGVSIYADNNFKTFNQDNGLPDNHVFAIYIAKDGTIYFGFWNNGIGIYKDGKFAQILNEQEGLPKSPVYAIHESKDGTIYIGTRGYGVYAYRDGLVKKVYDKDNGLTGNQIYSIHETHDDLLLFGTTKGLNILKNGQIDTLDITDGLTSNRIYGILQDDEGRLYLTTNQGVNIVDFSNQRTFIRTLRHSDGLASDECKQKVYFKDSQQNLWFGTMKGVTKYDPSKDLPNPEPPKVHIDRVSLLGAELPTSTLNEEPQFEHDQNYFKFDYIGINLRAPEKVAYRYRLSGVDKNWIETTDRSVRYANLNDGNYTFELKAGNEWDVWSEPVEFGFRILPPFWATWWFVALAASSIVALSSYLIRYRINYLLTAERLRTQIAADLHDSLGSDLAEITILSEVSTKQIAKNANGQAKRNLEKISQLSRSLVKSMSDIVWLVSPKRDTLHDLILKLRDSYEELLAQSGMIFKIKNHKVLNDVHLPMEYRQHLYLIFKEGINNCLMHSNCTRITLEAAVIEKELRMTLKDDGHGFNCGQSNGGNGLTNIKRRAEAIKGSVYINSKENGGTSIEFKGKV
jgi:ligand-binding sensor domain-containing protein/signal transduction histidine kinase